MKLKECKEGFYKLNDYKICEVIPTVNKGTWLSVYEAWSDETYKFSEKCSLRGNEEKEVEPIKVQREGYRVVVL